MEMHGMERDNSKVNKKKGANENVPSPKLNNRQKGYKKLLSEVNGKHMAVLLDSNGKEMGRVKVDSLIDAISKNKPDAVVFDGITTQRLVDNAFEHGVTKIISTKRGELSKVPSSITIITDDELR